jgi:hypothetical protein
VGLARAALFFCSGPGGRAKDDWFAKYFLPVLPQLHREVLAGENVIAQIERRDAEAAEAIGSFYALCQKYNGKAAAKTAMGNLEGEPRSAG